MYYPNLANGTIANRIPVLTVALLACACSQENSEPTAAPSTPGFVGSDECQSCHGDQFEDWQGSHHQLAMQIANDETVLGDFSNVTVPYFESEATFSKREGKFFVAVDSGDGQRQEFEITHTFGVTPLQQYLADAPGGRKQALQFAWDSRSQEDGGQRWYHLYPDEYIGPGDPLHWTGRYFNWNTMCAECHSTNVELGYDIDTDSFDTTYTEVSVGCEACHGPASRHVEQANTDAFDESWGLTVNLNDRADSVWIMNVESGIAERSAPNASRQQVESCGRCHSRRSVVARQYTHGTPLTETHMPSLLEEVLYHADGQILEEVYVYGSFVQSKMYAAGVTCTDCHNPHTGRLHAGPNPNDTCSTCHSPAKFASTDHKQEDVGDCINCHMPATTYMGVDDRRDHSFRLPNTATDSNHYGAAIAAGRQGAANDELSEAITNLDYPPIARATLLTLLEPSDEAADQTILLQQLDDSDPLVRIGVLRALRRQLPEIRLAHGSHLLRDPVRSVRVEAALAYVEIRDLLSLEDSRAFPRAADDYRESMLAASAMPDAALNLAEFETELGNTVAATRMYEHAIRIGADSAHVQHAYGLFLVRLGESTAALKHLHQASVLDRDEPQFAYVYGVALNSLGQADVALQVLSQARERFPDHFEIGWALATISRDTGDRQAARIVVDELQEQFPGNERLGALMKSLQAKYAAD